MKRIIYRRPDGGVSIVVPAPAFVAKFDTEDDALAAITAKNVPIDAADVTVCEHTDLPVDREFRDAWVRSGRGAAVDMPKARELQKGRIRDAKLAAARGLAEREMIGEDVTADKTALRNMNVDAAIDAAQNEVALRATWPRGLKK